MRLMFALLIIVSTVPAYAGGKITYFNCKADNEDATSVFGLDDSTKMVCDRSIRANWFVPTEFDAKQVSWNDTASTKTIYRAGKGKRYEHNTLILVHIGHCAHEKVPDASQVCKAPN